MFYYYLKGILEADMKLMKQILSRLSDDDIKERGGLIVRMTASGKNYYQRHGVDRDKRRIVKKLGDEKNAEVIRIKQQRYNNKLAEVLKKNLEVCETLLSELQPYDIDSIDSMLPEVYRDDTGLVNKNAAFMSYDDWMKKPFRRNGYKIPEKTNIAVDGTKVRSKSEVIIYDLLTFLGIPFKYDVDVNLRNENNEKVYKNVDFVIPSGNGSNILIEHLGMLSKEDYLENSFHKIRLYIMNGYALNETLFLTADDVYGNINAYTSKILFENLIIPQLRMRHTPKKD